MTAIGVVYRITEEGASGTFGSRAERLEYESVWVPEGWGESGVVSLAELACATTDLRLGSAILNVFSRTPAVLSMTAASLQRVSGDRFILGLGTSHPSLVEDLHGVSFERPIKRVHEMVDLLAALTAGDEPVSYNGEVFDVEGYEPLGRGVPVYNAAMGPANRRLTGAICDGWIPNQIPITELEPAFEAVAEGARAAGRSPAKITVSPWVPAAVADVGDEARDVIRRSVASYVGRFESYRRIVAESHPEIADSVASAWSIDEEAAVAAVTDDLVQKMGIAGTPDETRAQLAAVTDDSLLDRIIVSPPKWAPDRIINQTIEALAPVNQ